jgi:WXG100 family type VII secretion target
MANVQVTPEYVSQSAASCKSTATEIQEQLAALQSYITQMEGWWQGIASNTFQELMTEYSTYAQMLYNALNDIGSGLTGNYVNYTDTENANLSTITSIQASLSGTNFS